MPKFCPKCGAKIGAKIKTSLAPSVSQPPERKGGGGCGVGCAVGCLIVVLVFLLIVGGLIGFSWYFLSKMKKGGQPGDYFDIDPKSQKEKTVKCGDSFPCMEENLKKCAPAKGEAELGEFAQAEFEILGLAEDSDSCVVYAKIIEIKEAPEGLNIIPNFILGAIVENLSFECLIPEKVYQKGIEDVGEYIGDNLVEACEGPLFDLAEKWGVDLENLD